MSNPDEVKVWTVQEVLDHKDEFYVTSEFQMNKGRRSDGTPPLPLNYFTIEHRGSEPYFGNPKGIMLQLGSPETPVTFPFGLWRHGMTFKMLKTKVDLVTPAQQECVFLFDNLVTAAVAENVRAHGQGSNSAGCYVGPDPKDEGAINGNFYKCMYSEPPGGKDYAPAITCEFNCLQSGDLVEITADTPPMFNYDPVETVDTPLHLWPSWRTTWRVAKDVPGRPPVWHVNLSRYPVDPCEMLHIATGRIMKMTNETLPNYINKTMSPGKPNPLNPPTPKKMYGSVVIRIGRSYHHKNTVGLRRYGNRILIMGVQKSRARSVLPGYKEKEWLAAAANFSPDFNGDVEDPTVQAPAPTGPKEETGVDSASYYQN